MEDVYEISCKRVNESVFFFKQKTAYEVYQCDWSSDVCSSDLLLPITPVQILWINMITAVTLALTLAFEPPERNVMQRPPRNPKEPLLSNFLIWRIIFVSLILVTGTFGLFLWERDHGASIELARTVAVNTLVMFEIFYLFSARYLLAPSLTYKGLTGNRYVLYAIGLLILMQLGFTYLGPMQMLFSTTAMSVDAWLRTIVVASSVLFLVEIEKLLLRKHTKMEQRAS